MSTIFRGRWSSINELGYGMNRVDTLISNLHVWDLEALGKALFVDQISADRVGFLKRFILRGRDQYAIVDGL